MKNIFRQLRDRADERALRTASYCEECREACTSDNRRERLLDWYHQASTGTGFFRH